ncbi:transglycosylase domain-containing protein [Rathayibacter festucae]|nr:MULTISPECIES: transglycosylase domain-containing protein [Rathayibacter]MCJ1701382.1 transglycosylase domain-containing protein [Rathayibacter festucae]ROQ04195.1 membrane peptidoglycan carboxypeptidase [Rathayibacter sp. PhB93]ROQ60785.1 membrane peptidoglycan carboxypeptidase [Rathayibacter sp. PhB152]TDQ13032.1 membrane peptidoglycan carboxypeptidase [Rathayibacter sp. PhB1]
MALPTASRSSARPLGMSLRAVLGFIGMSAVAGVLITVGVTPALALTGLATSNTIGMFQNLPGYLDAGQLMQRTNIYAGDGTTLLASVYNQNRVEVGWDEVAQTAKDAAVAGEDPRFYEHGGIDLQGTLRALAVTLTGDDLQGGSSITQQYVKNVLVQKAESITDEAERDAAYKLATDPTPERKLKEMRLAIGLEKETSKDDILLGYLNIALFGGTVYGIEAAANYYYGIPASQLSTSQAASLLAIVNNPSKFRFDDPTDEANGAANGYAATKERRDYILTEELKYSKISQEVYDAAIAEPITPNITEPSTGCATAGDAAYFCEYVLNVLRNDEAFGADDDERYQRIRQGGFDIVTTLDLDIQQVSQAAINAYIPSYDSRFQVGATAASIQAGTGRVLSMVQNTKYSQDEEFLAANPGFSAINLNVDVAMGGTAGVQTGSTYKVFTLAQWLQAGHTLNESFPSPTSGFRAYPQKCNVANDGLFTERFAPRNDVASEDASSMTAVQATANSINTGFMGMANQLDLCDIRTTAESFGIHRANGNELENGAASVLGTNEIAPLTVANAYAGIANDGSTCAAIVIDRITDSTGAAVAPPTSSCTQSVTPEVARGMQYAMQRVITSGTATASDPRDGIEHIGKTGTTDEAADVWTAGASRAASLAVWVGSIKGFDDGSKQNLRTTRLTGEKGTIRAADARHAIWKPIMTALDQKYGGDDFIDPPASMLASSPRSATLTEVPDVTGLTVAAATATLTAAGFSVGVTEPVDSARIPEGSVVSTTPSADETVLRGAVIPLQVSTGKAPKNPSDISDVNGTLLTTASE